MAAEGADAAEDKYKGHKRPHELIPGYVKDKEKMEARKALMKAAASELGELRSSLDGEAWSLEVLCAKIMKRKTLYLCTADPQKPARHPVRPLDVLCEAKVSAASPTFIKCSCQACTGGAAGYAGGSFNSVRDFLEHGKSVFGPETVVVLAELELSWPDVLDLLRIDPTDHMWYCLYCEETIPSAPLRMCDGCQLACHGACYVRAYGQPLAAGAAAAGGGKGLDTRVLCVSCQDPELQTLQELQTVKIGGSKAGTARYTVPPLPHEVFRRVSQETQPSHFTKGTYDFWGPTQARLMDALVVKKDSPEAEAASAAVAAAEAAAAADEASNPPAAGEAAAGDTGQQGEGEDGQQQLEEEQQAEQEPPPDPAHKATHVLIVRDPAGRFLTVPYEYGKNHKTHGANRKLWVIKLMDQLGLHQGDLLVATKEPFEFKPLAVRQMEAQQQQQKVLHQPDGPWTKELSRCDKVLQLHIIRKGSKPPAAEAHAEVFKFKAANAAAAAGSRGRSGKAAAKSQQQSAKQGRASSQQQQSAVTSDPLNSQSASGSAADIADSEDGDADTAGDGDDYAPGAGRARTSAAAKGAALAGSFAKPTAKARAGQNKRSAAAAFADGADGTAGKSAPRSAPAYRFMEQQRLLQQQQLRFLEEEKRQREEQALQKQRTQQRVQERQDTPAAAATAAVVAVAAAGDGSPDQAAAEPATSPRAKRGGKGSRGGRSSRGGSGGRGRGRGHSKPADEEGDSGGEDSDYAAAEVAAALGARAGSKRRQSAARKSLEAVASTQVSVDEGFGLGRNQGPDELDAAENAVEAGGVAAAAAAADGSGGRKRQRKANSGTDEAAAGGADRELRNTNQQLQQELADARQQLLHLQQQLQQAHAQRDQAVTEREASDELYKQLLSRMYGGEGGGAAGTAAATAAGGQLVKAEQGVRVKEEAGFPAENAGGGVVPVEK